MLWGLHCAPFVSLLGTFVASLEHLGQSWGTLWDTWVSIETSSGHRRPLRKPRALKYRACAQKLTRWNLHADPGGPVGPVH